jgi:hypothetical protein
MLAVLGDSWTFAADTAAPVRAVRESASGQIDVIEGKRPVLRYNGDKLPDRAYSGRWRAYWYF